MCNFFSCDSDGNGKVIYFGAEARKKILTGELEYDPDSHTSIADYHGYKGLKEDTLNKYEYNPLTKEFTIDQLNTQDDSYAVKQFLQHLDFKTIVPELIIKPIINSLKIKRSKEVTVEEIDLLMKWASVWASVWDSVGTSVRTSVGTSVGTSVWNSVGASVGDPVGTSVWGSVGTSVWDSVGTSVEASVEASVGDSVWDSVWDSVGAYISSFFDIKYKHDFSSAAKLWEAGLVPSFDGKIWRLHSGEKAETVYELTI